MQAALSCTSLTTWALGRLGPSCTTSSTASGWHWAPDLCRWALCAGIETTCPTCSSAAASCCLSKHGGVLCGTPRLCAAATPPCCLAVSLLRALRQVEFQGIRHHMPLDRDVINSLELLAPSRHARPV